MKKLLAFLLFISFSFSASAQYIEGQETQTGSGEMMITTMMVGNDKDEHGCIGSAGYSWSEEAGECVRPWEEEAKICTMEYAPVCAQVQVQCIMAPCYPVAETFGNSCMAGDNPIIHKGECNSYLDMTLYSKYQDKETKIYSKIEKLNLLTLKKGVILIDKMIEKTKLMRMVQGALEERITGLIFIKHLFEKEIDSRK